MLSRPNAKVTMYFPQDLLEAIDGTAARLDITRSDLIRTAVAEYTRRVREERLKEELIVGYKANAKVLERTSEEFKHVDGENV